MNFGTIKKVCLIGGGEPMVHCGKYMKSKKIEVKAILAPRHFDTELPLSEQVLSEALEQADISYQCTSDIHQEAFFSKHVKAENYDIAICFGPAWVFRENIRAAFKYNMINFHPVPVPKYLGGAHFTWQILNNDRETGVTLQYINEKICQGDIIKANHYKLSDQARIPQDYFRENYNLTCKFLEEFVDELIVEKTFQCEEWHSEKVQSRRLYFPRLLTIHQAYINWAWKGAHIERFCCAFDKPYEGCSSYLDGKRIFLRNVFFRPSTTPLHPFCSGLVIRKLNDAILVSVDGGFLEIREILDEHKNDIKAKIKEGVRFYTPPQMLNDAMAFNPVIGSTKPH